MNTYDVVIVTKEYRMVQIDAENAEDAKDMAWDRIDSILNLKPVDYDTEAYVEGLASVSDETRAYGLQGGRP